MINKTHLLEYLVLQHVKICIRTCPRETHCRDACNHLAELYWVRESKVVCFVHEDDVPKLVHKTRRTMVMDLMLVASQFPVVRIFITITIEEALTWNKYMHILSVARREQMHSYRGNQPWFTTAWGESPDLSLDGDEPEEDVRTDGWLHLTWGFGYLAHHQTCSWCGTHAIMILSQTVDRTELVLQLLHHLLLGDWVSLEFWNLLSQFLQMMCPLGDRTFDHHQLVLLEYVFITDLSQLNHELGEVLEGHLLLSR